MDQDNGSLIEVVSYSGYKACERPLKVIIGGVCMEVTEVIDRWYGEEFDYFKVIVDTGAEYLIARHRGEDRWYLTARRAESGILSH